MILKASNSVMAKQIVSLFLGDELLFEGKRVTANPKGRNVIVTVPRVVKKNAAVRSINSTIAVYNKMLEVK